MIYGSSAWLLDTKLKKNLNGVSSKMLTSITKRFIHEEASSPTFDIVDHVLKRRKSYLGHILRLDPERGVRRYLLELNPDTTPFVPGSLLADTSFETVEDMIEAAQDRLEWAKDWFSDLYVYVLYFCLVVCPFGECCIHVMSCLMLKFDGAWNLLSLITRTGQV